MKSLNSFKQFLHSDMIKILIFLLLKGLTLLLWLHSLNSPIPKPILTLKYFSQLLSSTHSQTVRMTNLLLKPCSCSTKTRQLVNLRKQSKSRLSKLKTLLINILNIMRINKNKNEEVASKYTTID